MTSDQSVYYIISGYKTTISLLNKCAIINDISFSIIPYADTFEMSSDDIEKYIDMLIKLREYLIDKYDIFIIQEINDVLAQGQSKKLETLDNIQTSGIDEAEIANFKQVFDSPETRLNCSSIKDLTNMLKLIPNELDLAENFIETKIYTKLDLMES